MTPTPSLRVLPVAALLAAFAALCAAPAVASGPQAADATAATPPPAAPPPMREVVLVRHGHYAADPAIDARIGPGLSALGVAQARLVGARLAGDFGRIDGLHASPMQRARDTAASIGASWPARRFEVIDDLAECTPPTRRTEITARETPEALADCQAQFERLFARVFEGEGAPGRSDLYVCHGNVIRWLVTRALGVDSEAWLEMSIGHASITRIRIEPDGRYKVIAVGDVGHLPVNLRTGASGDPERDLAPETLPAAAPAAAN